MLYYVLSVVLCYVSWSVLICFVTCHVELNVMLLYGNVMLWQCYVMSYFVMIFKHFQFRIRHTDQSVTPGV